MPTDKPRFSITVDEKMLAEIDNFKEEQGLSSQSKAIVALIQMGMEELGNTEKDPPQKSDGSILPDGYSELSDQNRDLVDKLIAQLAKSESENQPKAGHAHSKSRRD